jgi:adenylate cyclase
LDRARRERLIVIAGLVTAAALVGARAQPGSWVERLDYPLWDLAQRHLLRPPPGEDAVTVVLVDDESLVRLGERWPLSRGRWADFLGAVGAYEPAAVLLDVWFETPASTAEVDLADDVLQRLQFTGLADQPGGPMMAAWLESVMADYNADRRFSLALSQSRRAVLGVACPTLAQDTFQQGVPLSAPFTLDVPASRLGFHCSRPVGSIPALALSTSGEAGLLAAFDADGVIRRYPFAFGTPQGAVAMLGTAAAILTWPDRADALRARAAAWAESPPLLRYRPSSSFRTVRFSDVLEAGPDSEPLRKALAGKAVLVGVSALGTEDARTTALEHDIPGVFVHANAMAALNAGDVLQTGPASRRVATWAGLLVLLVLGVLGPRLGSAASVSGVAALALLGWGGLAWVRLEGGEAFALSTIPLVVVAWASTKLVFQYLRNLDGRKQAAETRRAFAHYLAPAVVEQLVQNPDSLRLGGERKEITAFFSDIAGFTTISESMSPAELSDLLNDALGGMTEIILSEGGTIDKYIGDAIVAMFGAPLDQPDHADRAIRAAVRCQEWLSAQEQRWKDRGWPDIVNRIGLNSGPATVGNMGSAQRFDYTMLGDTVNLAARLEGANKVFGTLILIGPKTAEMASDKQQLRELDLLQVKGKTEGVRVFTTVSDPAVRERSDRALARYRAMDWAAARAAFAALGDDPTAAVFLERIDALEADPPEAGWNGVYQMTTK